MSDQPHFRHQDGLAHPRICCIIPCFNIAGVCGPVVDQAARYADVVIAIDDGSNDETGIRLQQAADQNPGKVRVLSHATNMGKGVVMMAAFRHALATLEFDVLVTLDGDGQHRPEDIPRLARELMDGGYALVIGERLARSKMPLRSRFGNALTALIVRILHPDAPVDTQSGLRAFSPDFAREVVQKIEGGRYETEMKILLLALTREHRIGSVTIPTVYIAGNRLSHFRPLVDSLQIYRILLSWRGEGRMGPASAISLDARPRA
jgi:glycosyltransferase involved in cell wall biosynthesis